MGYVLESENEAERLEKQNSQPQYQIERELDFLKLSLQNKKILDAGCGVGSLAKILAKIPDVQVEACDFSELRIEEAKKTSSAKNIHYFKADLTNIPAPDNCYDIIFTRFVLEHTKAPNEIMRELKRVLKTGGNLIVIDIDGAIFNLHHESPILKNYLSMIEEKLPIDLNIGRKLPRMLSEMGFKVSEFYVQPLIFRGVELEQEILNMQMRFRQTESFIKDIIGEVHFEHFVDLYISEMKKSEITVFYKYIVSAEKNAVLSLVPKLGS